MKTAGYIRVSTESQVKDGFGLDIQKEAIEKYAQDQDIGSILFYEEKGQSGAVEDRPALAELRADIEDGQIDTVIILRLDRLARDLLLQETIISDFQKHGAIIYSIKEPDLCSSDPSRVMVRQIMGAVNQYEAALITARLRAGKHKKAQAGGFAGGQRPLGYKKTLGFQGKDIPDLTVKDTEARTVARIFELRGQGETLDSIVETLNLEGHKTKRGGSWYRATVKYILDNSIYQGNVSHGNIESQREDLAIIRL